MKNKTMLIEYDKFIDIKEKLPIVAETILCVNIDEEWVEFGAMGHDKKFINLAGEIIPTHWVKLKNSKTSYKCESCGHTI